MIHFPPLPRRNFGDWIGDHWIEVSGALLIAGLLVAFQRISSTEHDQDAMDERLAMATPAMLERLNEQYPDGYQLFVIERAELLPASPGTFKDRVDVSWRYSQVVMKSDEKIKINIFRISIPSQRFTIPLLVDIPLKEDHAVITTSIRGLDLTVEVLARFEEKILCALAVRKN